MVGGSQVERKAYSPDAKVLQQDATAAIRQPSQGATQSGQDLALDPASRTYGSGSGGLRAPAVEAKLLEMETAVERLEKATMEQAERLEALEQFQLNKIRYEVRQTKDDVLKECQ